MGLSLPEHKQHTDEFFHHSSMEDGDSGNHDRICWVWYTEKNRCKWLYYKRHYLSNRYWFRKPHTFLSCCCTWACWSGSPVGFDNLLHTFRSYKGILTYNLWACYKMDCFSHMFLRNRPVLESCSQHCFGIVMILVCIFPWNRWG